MLHGNKINRSCSEYIWKMIHFGSLEKSSVFLSEDGGCFTILVRK